MYACILLTYSIDVVRLRYKKVPFYPISTPWVFNRDWHWVVLIAFYVVDETKLSSIWLRNSASQMSSSWRSFSTGRAGCRACHTYTTQQYKKTGWSDTISLTQAQSHIQSVHPSLHIMAFYLLIPSRPHLSCWDITVATKFWHFPPIGCKRVPCQKKTRVVSP